MQRLIAWYRLKTADTEGYIPALNGFRVLMVGMVASFHIWQQSWLTPTFTLFGQTVSMDYLLRSGYLWVDGMLLLSGFLLYLPFALAKEKETVSPPVLPFYQKRCARILPSYFLCVLVMLLFVALPQQRYATSGDMAKDVLAHLTFTFPFWRETLHATPLNGALWTVAVEMQFYLLFPLLGRAFRRQPILTYSLMTLCAFLFRRYAASLPDSSMLLNQLPAFLDVYANGFVAASCYTSIKRKTKEDVWTRIMMTACLVLSALLLRHLLMDQAAEYGVHMIRLGQLNRRFGLSVILSVMFVSAPLSLGGVRLLLGNRMTRVLSGVSYQFYIWHQVFAVQLKNWGIPHSLSPLPQQAGDYAWQTRYTALCYLGALAISFIVTYLFERPLSRRLNKQHK